MHTSRWSVLAAVLFLSLALGCSRGLAPTDEPRDGGIGNHLGDAPAWIGNVQVDSGSVITPGGGGGGGGGGGSDAGGGGGTTGAGICGTDATTNDATLDACLDSRCCTSFTACYADSACGACLADPAGAGCSSNNLFRAFDTCWATSCDTGGGGTAGTCCDSGCYGDTCDDYINANCCSSLDACLADSTCNTCLTSPLAPASCDSNSLLAAFEACVCGGSGATTSCSAECGGGGGTTGNGVCDSGETTGDTSVDACLSGSCCTQFHACAMSTACMDCMYGSGTRCASNSTYVAFDDCWFHSCD